MSPSLWFAQGAIFDWVRAQPFVDARIYLDTGAREGERTLGNARRLRDLLVNKGYVPGERLAVGGGCHRRASRKRLGSSVPQGAAGIADGAEARTEKLMHHEYQSWRSPALMGIEMGLHVWGHAGAKMLVFPSSLGSHREWTDRKMHLVLRDQIDERLAADVLG